jgi:hypothetical protein
MTSAAPVSAAPGSPAPANGGPPGAGQRLPLTPGRRAALVLGVPVVLAGFAVGGVSLVSRLSEASYAVNYTVPVRSGHVTVSLGDAAAVSVREDAPATSTTARVSGVVDYSLVRPALKPDHSGINCPSGLAGWFANCGLGVTVDAPAGAALDLATGGGSLTVARAASSLTLDSGGGPVEADNLSGPASISTEGGGISASAVTSARVIADSGGGPVTLEFTTVPRYVRVTASGGSVSIIVPHAKAGYAITTTSAGGSVSQLIPSTPHAPNVINVDSGGGPVTIAESG